MTMIETDGLEAEKKVERFDERLRDLREQRNRLVDRSDEIRVELRDLKTKQSVAITSGDLDGLADDSLDQSIRKLEKEAARISQSVKRLKSQIRKTEQSREITIGSAVDHFDAKLAADEEEIRKKIQEIAEDYRDLYRRWTDLERERRKLVNANNAWRAPSQNRRHLGRRDSDIPPPLEVTGDEIPSPSWLDAELPHLAPWTPKRQEFRQAEDVRMVRRSK